MQLKIFSPLATRHSLLAKDILRQGVLALQSARIESASLDARLLLEHVLECSREQLLFRMERPVTPDQETLYQALIEKRAERRPVSQLIGKREFWGMEFKVTADTLDPRPDSETLIDEALARTPNKQAKLRILDLGTGTGCLLLALLKELPNAAGVGADLSESALAVAKENAVAHGLQERAKFIVSHWMEKVEGAFDIVISNPPYILSRTIETLTPEVARFEPKLALDGGEDGLDCYRAIIPKLSALLAPGGFAALEIGMGQKRDIEEMVDGCRLLMDGIHHDLSGIARCVVIRPRLSNDVNQQPSINN